MADNNTSGVLDSDSATLSPLPSVLRRGLPIVAVCAFVSFVSTLSLLAYLARNFVQWWRHSRHDTQAVDEPDFSLGLAPRHFRRDGTVNTEAIFNGELADRDPDIGGHSAKPNQFLILVFMLFLADLGQSISFLINLVWLAQDGIIVGTRACNFQGFLLSNGNLASSCFITAIAFHTYLAVARNYKPPQWTIYATCVGLWIFTWVNTIMGLGVTRNGKSAGGFFVRCNAWCWMNVEYTGIWLGTHYVHIFASLTLTCILYTATFTTLYLRSRRSRASAADPSSQQRRIVQTFPGTDSVISLTLPPPDAMGGIVMSRHAGVGDPTATPTSWATPAALRKNDVAAAHRRQAMFRASGYQPAFLAYPLIYLLCTVPLAVGRVSGMAGVTLPLSYFCVAGAAIASNGWLDVLLWSTTRRALLFGGPRSFGRREVGLGTFAFALRTPERRFGNMVWIEGGGGGEGGADGNFSSGDVNKTAINAAPAMSRAAAAADHGDRLVPPRPRRHHGPSSRHAHRRSSSRDSNHCASLTTGGGGGGSGGDGGGRDMTIKMDLVTSVVVEDADPEDQELRELYARMHTADSSRSVASSHDKEPRVPDSR